MVFYEVFLLSPLKCTVTHCKNFKRLREFQEIDSQDKVVEWTLNSKEENSYDFCLDFVQEFGLKMDFGVSYYSEFSWLTVLNEFQPK